ncbi:unnamed protein product [Lactuca virosa]|uniref:Uncharacterized protein n=1 Tax=Lactuca virosa TaxID=75947 RepID=A0AAU9N101_9ASTR|nr:unnamed protein product [Lactuca virosa]
MPSIGHAEHIWSPNYRRHMDANQSNGVTNKDMAINLLQTQLELSLIRDDFQDQLCELRQAVNRDSDAMNREVNDVRDGQLDISHLVADLKDHFISLQGSYVKIVTSQFSRPKILFLIK